MMTKEKPSCPKPRLKPKGQRSVHIDEVLAEGVAILAKCIPALIVWEAIKDTLGNEQTQRVRDEYEKRLNR